MDIRSVLWTPIKHGILPCPFVKFILSWESPDQDPLKCMTCNWNYRHASCLSSSRVVLCPSISYSGLHLVIHGESCTPDVLFICRGIPNTLAGGAAVLSDMPTCPAQIITTKGEISALNKPHNSRWRDVGLSFLHWHRFHVTYIHRDVICRPANKNEIINLIVHDEVPAKRKAGKATDDAYGGGRWINKNPNLESSFGQDMTTKCT